MDSSIFVEIASNRLTSMERHHCKFIRDILDHVADKGWFEDRDRHDVKVSRVTVMEIPAFEIEYGHRCGDRLVRVAFSKNDDYCMVLRAQRKLHADSDEWIDVTGSRGTVGSAHLMEILDDLMEIREIDVRSVKFEQE